jgi:hypothetical protein
VRRLTTTIAVAMLALGVGAGVAVAETREDTETARISGSDVALDYPSSWIEVPIGKLKSIKVVRAYLKEHPKLAEMMSVDPNASNAELRRFINLSFKFRKLTRIDTTDGDNVIVSIMPGPWWNGLDDWKHYGDLSAKSTNAVVLSDAKTSVGGHPAYTHIERDADGIYGYMEVKQPHEKAVTIAVTTTDPDPAAARAILDSVRPAQSAR